MGKIQGYSKRYKSTTLSIYKNDRDRVEILWDDGSLLVFLNNEYKFTISNSDQLSSTSSIENFDSTKESYIADKDYVSYVNTASPIEEFTVSYIYRCIEDTSIGQSPEYNPEKWERQGLSEGYVSGKLLVSDIQGLQDLLDNKINYNDLSDEFSIDTNNKISLNIDYITLSDYSPAEDIQPDPEPSAAIILSTQSVSTSEGSSVQVSVYLQRTPTADVVLGIASNDTDIATVDDSTLTFTSLNYSTPQIITINGINDLNAVTDITTIVVSIDNTTDNNFAYLSSKNITVSVNDLDIASYVVTKSNMIINEGEQDVFSVYLTTEPSADVTINLTGFDTNVVTLDKASLLFTVGNYSTPQIVTVTAIDDESTVDLYTTILLSTSSADLNYNNLADKIIDVTNVNLDSIATNEIKLGNTIWKTSNETWNDGGDGIFYPNNDINNVDKYGLLYTQAALERLLAAQTDYRIPNCQDWIELYQNGYLGTNYTFNTANYQEYSAGGISDETVTWNYISNPAWVETSGLKLRPSGYVMTDSNNNLISVAQFSESGNYYTSIDDINYTRHTYFNTLFLNPRFTEPRLRIRKDLAYTYLDAYVALSVRLVKDI